MPHVADTVSSSSASGSKYFGWLATALAVLLTAACGGGAAPAGSSPSSAPAAAVPVSASAASSASAKPAAGSSVASAPASAKPVGSSAASGSAKPAASASASAGAASGSPAANADFQAQWDKLVAAAKTEGKVVVATSPDDSFRTQVLGAFEKKYGIQAQNLSAPGNTLINKFIQEKSAGVHSADVSLSSDPATEIAYPAGIYTAIKPAIIIPDASDPSKWINHKGPQYMDPPQTTLLQVAEAVGYTFAVNPDKVDPTQFKTPQDLLDPKWKGQIGAYDATIAGIGQPMGARILKTMGEDYFKKLYVGQAPHFAQDDRTMGDWVGRGTYPIGIGLAADEAQRIHQDGLKSVVLKMDYPMAAGIANAQYVMSLMDQAPHPNAAKLFVNWMLTQEAMQTLVNADGTATTRTDMDYSKIDPDVVPQPNHNYFNEADWTYLTTEQRPLFDREKVLIQGG